MNRLLTALAVGVALGLAVLGLDVFLDENVIEGRTTSICVRDASLDSVVTAAIELWNDGTDDELVESIRRCWLHPQITIPVAVMLWQIL